MRFAHTDDELEFASAVRSLFDNECPPEVVRAAWPADADKGEGSRAEPDAVDRLWEQLAQMGVLGACAFGAWWTVEAVVSGRPWAVAIRFALSAVLGLYYLVLARIVRFAR